MLIPSIYAPFEHFEYKGESRFGNAGYVSPLEREKEMRMSNPRNRVAEVATLVQGV